MTNLAAECAAGRAGLPDYGSDKTSGERGIPAEVLAARFFSDAVHVQLSHKCN